MSKLSFLVIVVILWKSGMTIITREGIIEDALHLLDRDFDDIIVEDGETNEEQYMIK